MGMVCGGANVAIIKNRSGAMYFDAYESELAAVCAMIDNGSLAGSGGLGYGSAGHVAAIVEVERQIAITRREIKRMAREVSA